MCEPSATGVAALAAALLLLALLSAIAPAPAVAQEPGSGGRDVDAAGFRALAGKAAEDPAALSELREVGSIDGRPVDVEATLAGATGAELEARLREMARSVGTGSSDQGSLPGEVGPLLEGPPPAPASGGAGGESGEVLGLPPLAGIGIAVLVVVAAALVAARAGSRRLPVELGGTAPRTGDQPLSPADRDWEGLATEAERDGRWGAAVRFRYRAGLRSLADAGALELRPSLTSGEVRRTVFSPRLDGLLNTFESVAYGGRPASEQDAAHARTEWPLAVEEARGA